MTPVPHPLELARPEVAALVQAVVDALAVPAALCLGQRLVGGNHALQRLAGRSAAQLAGHDVAELLDDEPAARAALRAALRLCQAQGQEPPALGARLRRPGGGQRPVEISLRPLALPADSGGGHAAVLTCTDLSDLEHVQTGLAALDAMLRQVVDGAPLATFVLDRNHRVTHWNAACERLTGHTAASRVGRSDAWRAFYADARPLLADLMVDGCGPADVAAQYNGAARPSPLMAGALEAEAFFPHFGPGGAWLYFTAAPLRGADGQVIGAIETLQDVSARRQAEQELLKHRNQLEQRVQARSAELATSARELTAFIANAPIGVLYTRDGVVQRGNRQMAQLFGRAEAQLPGMPARALFLCDADHAELGRLAGPLLSAGQPLHHEMWMARADGTPLWVQLSAHVADPEDTGRGTWWMLQDRSDIRSTQAQLQARLAELQETNLRLGDMQSQLLEQDKMASLGQLAAGVAHEINNPVGFVTSNLNTLRQYGSGLLALVGHCEQALAHPGDAAVQAALVRCRQEVELDYLREDLPVLLDECADGLGRVKKIVQDLKDFSRVDQDEWQQADLNAGLESSLNMLRHEVRYKAEVVRHLVPLPPVTCLAAQLNQVFMNFIVNAAHAIEERGTITLSSGHVGAWAWVQVGDSGCGMSAEVQRRIFEPFYTTKAVGQGTGLGLSLSFSIVQKHGGEIQVRSAPGAGTRMRVWVPVGGPASLPAGAEAAPTHWEGEDLA